VGRSNEQKSVDGRLQLHWDGVVGVARDVPAGAGVGVGEEGAAAGDVFFGMDGVDLVFHFVAFVGNEEYADAMDGGSGGSELGSGEAEVVPGEIHGVDDEKESRQRSGYTRDKSEARRGLRLNGHGTERRVVFCLGNGL
jgi:hypothetical protein